MKLEPEKRPKQPQYANMKKKKDSFRVMLSANVKKILSAGKLVIPLYDRARSITQRKAIQRRGQASHNTP